MLDLENLELYGSYFVHTTHAISFPLEYGGHFMPVHVVSMKYSTDFSLAPALPATDSAFTSAFVALMILFCHEVAIVFPCP